MAVYIVRRTTKDGSPRFLVRWQKGRYGRDAKQHHLGSFKTRAEANARKRWAELEIAAGRTPDVKRLFREEAGAPTLAEAARAWLASRVDVTQSSRDAYRDRIAYLEPLHGHRVDELDAAVVQAWIAGCGLAASTIRNTVATLHAILEHAGTPLEGPRLRVPKRTRKAKYLPPRADLAAVYAVLKVEYVPVVLLLEHCGLRVNEAVGLENGITWGDIDEPRQRFLAHSKTDAGTRWVDYSPAWCEWAPPALVASDRSRDQERPALRAPDLRVYPFTIPAIQGALAYACKRAGVNPFGPHSLRHLHISRCLHYGWLSPAEIAARVGHASAKTTLGTYSWLVPPD